MCIWRASPAPPPWTLKARVVITGGFVRRRGERAFKTALTEGFVLAADVAPVAESLQRAEQEAVVQLPGAVGLVPVGDLGDLYVS